MLHTSMNRFCFALSVIVLLISAPQRQSNAQDASQETIQLDWSAIGEKAHQIRVTPQQDSLSLLTLGSDPYFRFQMPSLETRERDWILQWEYFCADGVGGMEWRSGRNLGNPVAKKLPPMPNAEGWTVYTINLNELSPDSVFAESSPGRAAKMRTVPVRIDLGGRSGLRLQVRNVVVRPMNDQEFSAQQASERIRERKQTLADRIAAYQLARRSVRIESAAVVGDRRLVKGKLTDAADVDAAFLIRRHPESSAAESPTRNELSERWPIEAEPGGKSFRVSIPDSPTFSNGSRLQVFRDSRSGPQAVSAAFYVRPPSVIDVPAPKPLRTAKGLTCITSRFTSDQLRDLGLQHATVNVILSGLVSETIQSGWTETEIDGVTWWVNESRLRQLDRNVRTANDAGLVVAATLLIPTPRRHPSPLAHPESNRSGTYAMPNLGDREANRRYAATLDVLGKRYSGAFPDNGRVDHWIVHNEVDYGWQWTNMGEQPFDIYMDHYVRSMRMVSSAVNRYNAHAHVFISLTHRWNTNDNQAWRTYAPKQMVEWLVRDCSIAGDFPWGIAYHPYPQSLWKADFWNDRNVSDDFDTKLITIKNLQVLDRYMHLPSSRAQDGSLRPVICSEQGFHAAADNPEQLHTQAVALLRTWEKIRQCPSILAFDYHRPSDHPNEGGLLLGLRGLPSAEDRLGAPKPAWEVYSAIGTEREAELAERYLKP